ncbi:MAG TPA: dual specificity protein phosphatase family protein [Blastocatellia bacterium]|nr:dual specificity protein phosphatase family protein [Blastocatellia bacterium]
MRAFRRLSPGFRITTVILALAIISVAQAAQSEKSPKIKIKNFGCVNEKLYRGAQPKAQDYADLAALGVKTIIDLQKEGEADEQSLAEAQGIKFYRIKMSDRDKPAAEQAELFLKLVNDPANQPVFIHCKGGRHRTGAMTAIYRLTHDGWTADQAFLEMKQYDFDYGFGHTPLKRFVFDYYSNIDSKSVVVNSSNR